MIGSERRNAVDSEEKPKRRKGTMHRIRVEMALRALLLAPTVEAAAQMAGVGEATLHRWLKVEAFRARVDAALQEAFSGAMRTLIGRNAEAIAALHGLLKSGNENIRLRAALGWIEHAHRSNEALTLEGEVEKLRLQVAEVAERHRQEQEQQEGWR